MNACLLCERTSDTVTLLTIEFRGNALKICSQHLPILIHDPGQLIGIVEGAEQLEPSAHRD